MPEKRGPWTTKSVSLQYENPWIEVTEHEVVNPSGGDGIYGVVRMKTVGAGIIPIDDEGYTWLVGQWRYTLDAYSWEIPEGGGDPALDPVLAAKRELLEETGLVASEWTELLRMHTSNSVTTEVAYVYLARGIAQQEACPEASEGDLVVRRLPFKEAVDMVMRGEITDSMAVAGLLKADRVLNAGPLA